MARNTRITTADERFDEAAVMSTAQPTHELRDRMIGRALDQWVADSTVLETRAARSSRPDEDED